MPVTEAADLRQPEPAPNKLWASGGPAGGPNRSRHLGDETVAELVRLAAKKDDRAWSELVGRFDQMVFRVAKRSGLNDSDAAEVKQVTWLRLMKYADQLRDPERVGAWLATTARRESVRIAIAAERQVVSANPVEEFGPEGTAGSGVDQLALRQTLDPVLEGALHRLPAQYRRLIQLLTSDACLSYADVAKVMGLPAGSIGPMRLRCLQMLRRHPELQALNRF